MGWCPPPLSEEEVKRAQPEVLKQVEYYFSDDELCRNTYLRWNMDSEGYIPAAIVFNFPNIIRFGLPYTDLLAALLPSQTLQIDLDNETIRLRHNFKRWLCPNPDGTLGCPRWIKQAVPVEAVDEENTAGTPELVHCTDSDESVGEYRYNEEVAVSRQVAEQCS